MKIGISEPFPLLEYRLQDLYKRHELSLPPKAAKKTDGFFDLILSDRNYFDSQSLPQASLYLISGEILPENLKIAG